MSEPPGAEREGGTLARVLGSRWTVAVAAVALVALAAWRSTIGMSLADDGYYAATTVRLAQGARLFVDEMYVQSLGFLVAVPFAKFWLAVAGLSHVVVALRLYYVALAAAAGAAVYRLLRPSFGAWPCLLGAAAVFLAPTYNLLAVSYDTMAAMGLLLACVLAFAGWRDDSRRLMAAAGAAAAFSAISYPPFALAAVALLVTVGVRTRARGWRSVGAIGLGAAVVVAAFAVWLVATLSFAEMRAAAEFILTARVVAQGGEHPLSGVYNFTKTMGLVWLGIPVWAYFLPAAGLSGLATWRTMRGDAGVSRPTDASTGTLALAAIPVALLLPVVADALAPGHGTAQTATLGANYLIGVMALLAPPVAAGTWRARDRAHDLVLISLAASTVACLVILRLSFADIFWGSEMVGLAPLAVAFLVWWADRIARERGVAGAALGAVSVLCVLLALLFGYAFKDAGAPLAMHDTIASGAYAGVTTSASRAAQVEGVTALSKRWIGPDTRVLVVGAPTLYLLAGGVPLTNVTWHDPQLPIGPFTISYLDAAGRWPDVVIVPRGVLPRPGAVSTDPFVTEVMRRYRVGETSAATGFVVFVSRATG